MSDRHGENHLLDVKGPLLNLGTIFSLIYVSWAVERLHLHERGMDR